MSRNSLRRGSPARFVGFVIVLLIAVLGSAAVAQASTASFPATVTGYIETTAGVGIPNVLVQIGGATDLPAPWDAFNTSFSQEATTDATGRYVITDVIQGTYEMFVNDPTNPKHVAAYSEAIPWHDDWGLGSSTLTHITGGANVNVAAIKLPHNGTVNGRALDVASPIVGSQVVANITTGGVVFTRWTDTDSSGNYSITDAPPGEWSVTMTGKDREIPVDAVPMSQEGEYGPVTQSPLDTFTLAEGQTANRPVTQFSPGRLINIGAVESHDISTYWLSSIALQVSLDSDPDNHTYYLATNDDGFGHAYLPAGSYTLTLSDGVWAGPPVYNTTSTPLSFLASASPLNMNQPMPPSPGSFAVFGHISEYGSPGSQVESRITASLIDPSSPWLNPYRVVPSNGSGNSLFMVRLPSSTGFTGNKIRLDFNDLASPPDVPYVHMTKSYTIVGSATDQALSPALYVGGTIAGTIHDGSGNPVDGCTVYVTRKAFDPALGEIAWIGTDTWWTRTDINGDYSIGGMPTATDYKVNVVPDYNPGMDLLPMYQDYYRRVYKGQPLVDSLNTSATPIGGVVDHTPVAVTIGHTTPNIDETITPGGYVALHADGPLYPTGAVWVDVTYQYAGQWFEIDSGYTTGGLFQKMWKVLPTGNYRVKYNDYFGRGGGTWSFSLAPNEHKYASVLVPAPVTILSGGGLLNGSFAGLLGGGTGLPLGGTGGTMLQLKYGSIPTTAPPLPYGTVGAGSTYNASLASGAAQGVWTLTLPYDGSIPAADVANLRVIHYKQSGGSETLYPIGWNTTNHTIMVQTGSLSPFRIVFKRHTVKLGTPVASGTWSHTKYYTVYGTLWPFHASGVKSVQLMIYKRNSRGKYVWLKNVWAPNYTYRGSTRYRASLKLGAGKYHIYANAVSDRWHFATKTKYYKYVLVK